MSEQRQSDWWELHQRVVRGETLSEAEQRQYAAFPKGVGARPGWLPDDELTREWLRHIEEYRAECDERDRCTLEESLTDEQHP